MLRLVALLAVVCAGSAAIGCSRAPRRAAALTAADVALNNRAVGLMGQFEYGQAREIFGRLVAGHPDQLDLQVNLAIATLHRQADGDSAAAQHILERVLAVDRGQLRAHYSLGLLLLHDGHAPEALPHFLAVIEREPTNAFAQYFAAQCQFQESQFAAALRSYEQALAGNPRLRSAAYGAFQARQRLGRADAAEMLERFRALETNPQSEIAEFKYTRLGPLADAATIDQPVAAASRRRPDGAIFEPGSASIEPLPGGVAWHHVSRAASDGSRPISITAADIDGDGRIDLFIPGVVDDHGAIRNAVLLNRREARLTLDLTHPLASVTDVVAALWGDIDNDGLVDVYLCRNGANQLWRQTAKQQWTRVGAAAHVEGGGGVTIDGALVDADHDGDLDVILIKSDGANELLNNNGDGTFRSLGAMAGWAAADRRAASGIVVADLDRDRDVDVFAVRIAPPHDVQINERGWRYRGDSAFDALAAAPIAAAVAGDVDADGQTEIYTSDGDGIRQWSRSGSTTWTARTIGGTKSLANSGQLALADVDGDGRLDLIATSVDGGWRAITVPNSGDSAPLYTANGAAIAGWAVAMLDANRGPSIVALPANAAGGPQVWNPGTGRFAFVSVSPTGRDPRSRQIRSNVSGIGTQLAARTGSRWTAADTYRSQSGIGQSLQPIAIGTGGAAQIDFVALVWSDGVLQTELGLVPGAVRTIAETQRQLSSCPVLFAFDGHRFAFITDLLGVGGIGTPTEPGVYAPPRPRENLLLPDGVLAARDGRFVLKITEPMEEVAYIDAARLVAYDLPPGWQLALDERQATTAPEATGAPVYYRDERLPVRAVAYDRGAAEDVTRAITAADGIAAPAGRVDPRHIGRTDEHLLTLRFAERFDTNRAANWTLVGDGWIEYPYAQTLFAAWQAGAAYRPPTIEARGAGELWRTVREHFGYPAGMPRRISVPLGALPPGTTELRLRTTQEIYWDRLAVVAAAECPRASTHTLELETARVARSGFPKREMAEQRRPSYDYDHRAPLWDVRYPSGFYTAEGEATRLLNHEDGAVAIIGPGEELHLEFDARQSPLPAGWTRRFVLEARGWCKDMDLYTKNGDTVAPIPGVRDPNAQRLQQQYTTRYESGR